MKDKDHLIRCIKREMKLYGEHCDLNHLDVSKLTDMSYLFFYLNFNGNISTWDVSHVEYMDNMFNGSKFNGNISQWDVSNVTSMIAMFEKSQFNKKISTWNVSKVDNMTSMFAESKFTGDLTDWKPYNLTNKLDIFKNCAAPKTYWYLSQNPSLDIAAYDLQQKLEQKLILKPQVPRVKI